MFTYTAIKTTIATMLIRTTVFVGNYTVTLPYILSELICNSPN